MTWSEGGARIDVGEIVDGGFVIQQTAFVCSGEPEAAWLHGVSLAVPRRV